MLAYIDTYIYAYVCMLYTYYICTHIKWVSCLGAEEFKSFPSMGFDVVGFYIYAYIFCRERVLQERPNARF